MRFRRKTFSCCTPPMRMVQSSAGSVHAYPVPEATEIKGKGTDNERRLEYYVKPHYAVQTLILKNGSPVSCRMGFYSPELYQATLPKSP